MRQMWLSQIVNRCNRIRIHFLILFTTLICFLCWRWNSIEISPPHRSLRLIYELTEDGQKVQFSQKFKGYRNFTKSNTLHLHEREQDVSNTVQNQIREIQEKSCEGPNLICGHFDVCGFGCQIHHRVACLMMSYVLKIPLIHDETVAWPFSEKWGNVFQKLGSNCTPGPQTYQWTWNPKTSGVRNSMHSETLGDIHYPLDRGLPVPEDLGNIVDQIHPNPYLWWVGQFVKYSLTLNKQFEKIFRRYKAQIGFDHRIIVGIQVRRTDKIQETIKSHHEVEEYMKHAEEFFEKVEIDQNIEVPRRVFVASDDSSAIKTMQSRYPNWRIQGFAFNETLRNQREREHTLKEIVLDVLLLSECDYIICGYSSNVCRLLLEIQSFKDVNALQRLKSLDGVYEYILQGHTIQPSNILKVKSLSTTANYTHRRIL